MALPFRAHFPGWGPRSPRTRGRLAIPGILRGLPSALALAVALVPDALAGQGEVPSLRWQTIRTEHFRIHYEPGLEGWARELAGEIESVRQVVSDRVGYAPPQVVDLIVEDPFNVPNGSAWPALGFPAMRFWATPPAPSSVIGHSRGWGELLAIHEYAHLAHLLRPSRRPTDRILAATGFLSLGPLTRAPAWVTEGYATLIEGELTGSGRPNGVARAAVLRQLALEGYLPAYGELDATGRFQGGAMRYLVGSAYLEWLQAPRGDSVLPELWRRATARRGRDFPEAFRGTFGDAPDVLYGRFASELTHRAHQAQQALEEAGLARGTLVQHWDWGVGAPAISPDGKRIAIRRSSPGEGSRIVVASLEPPAPTAEDSIARARILERDPEDLPDVEVDPRPLEIEARLGPVGGNGHDGPRWFADGTRLLVTRSVPRPDGRVRPDLFVWEIEGGDLHRVTYGAGIAMADPLPDGSAAIGLTCGGGSCSLVRIGLPDGAISTLAQGGTDASYHGVRVSPDGSRVASARQRVDGSWEPVLIDIGSGAIRPVGPSDGASRHSPAWEGDSALVVVSDASGVPVLERLGLDGAAPEVVARTSGAAMEPEVGPDGRIWWLDLHGRGYDLRVSEAGRALPVAPPLDPGLFPAVRRVDASRAVALEAVEPPPARPYGSGPVDGTLIFGGTEGADGESNAIGVHLNDPLGRGSLYAIAGTGSAGAWGGWRTALTWRGLPATLQVQLFDAGVRTSRQQRIPDPALDLDYRGALLTADWVRAGIHGPTAIRAGASAGRWTEPRSGADSDRTVVFAEVRGDRLFTPFPAWAVRTSIRARHSEGSTGGARWSRSQGEVALSMGRGSGVGVGVRAKGGRTDADAPPSERFRIGGSATPFLDDALLDPRIPHPGLPVGVGEGIRYAILSAETSGPVRLYHDWVVAGSDVGGPFSRVAGVELSLDLPRTPVLRIPPGSARIGVSQVLHDASGHGLGGSTTVYGGLIFRP